MTESRFLDDTENGCNNLGTSIPVKCTMFQPLKVFVLVGGVYAITSFLPQSVEFDNINDLNYEELFSCGDLYDAIEQQEFNKIRDIISELDNEAIPITLPVPIFNRMVFRFNKPVKKIFSV